MRLLSCTCGNVPSAYVAFVLAVAYHQTARPHAPPILARRKHGRFIETGTANDLVEKPQRKDTQVYIKLSEENEERSHGKNLRNAYQQGESVFQL